jgi:MerR family transcriptional regulator/heat shock protein HspR
MLTGMHPQTLRKYEKAGLLEPSRRKRLRMYSDEDIERLRVIKYLVDEKGLNLAGVRIAVSVHDTVANIREQLESAGLSNAHRKHLLKSLDKSLEALGTVMGQTSGREN